MNSREYFFVHLSVCVLRKTVHCSIPIYNTAIQFRAFFHDGNTILETNVHTLKKVDDQTNDVWMCCKCHCGFKNTSFTKIGLKTINIL